MDQNWKVIGLLNQIKLGFWIRNTLFSIDVWIETVYEKQAFIELLND